jgi:hypothetical protein
MTENSSQVPLIEPIMVVIPAGTTRTISFSNEFFGIATSLLITNLDAANVATYQIGGAAMPSLNLATNAFRTIDNTKIKLITITAGAAGAVQLEAQVQRWF